MSKCVWVLVDEEITEHLINVQESDARSWIFSLIETLKHDDLIRVLVTLWAIWYARRKAIHDNIFQSPLSTFPFVNSFISDLTMAEGKKGVHVQQGHTQQAGWIPPPEGLVKINVDAATSKNTNRGAIAAVARSSDGVYLGASSVVFDDVTDAESLEALACREAVALSRDLLLRKVMVVRF
jgi:hypothetical protein